MTNDEQQSSDQQATTAVIDGNFRLRVSDDEIAVFLDELNPPVNGGAPVSLNQVLDELKKQNISYGIDNDKITDILSLFSGESPISEKLDNKEDENRFCIAKGEAAVDGEDGALVWQVDEEQIQKGEFVVSFGELVATYKSANQGKPGMSVYAKEIPALNGKNNFPRIGNGIETIKNEQGDEYRASNLGVVVFEQEEDSGLITVNSKVEVTEDGMEARVDLYARTSAGNEIECDDVVVSLEANDIKHGIDRSAIQEALIKASKLSSDQSIGHVDNVVVARGTLPQEGKDAELTISREEKAAGAELANGRIDFHERDYPWNVSQGEKIGYLLEAKPAVDGIPVYGGTVEAEPPKDIELELEGVHKDEQGMLIADMDGALIINGYHIAVVDLLVIKGDVAQDTGNIHSNTAVHVKGHVEPGYVLESKKEIIVENNIEDATVQSGSTVLIKGGIRGKKSKLSAPGDVSVGFIENASVFVNGDLTVTSSIINSTVASNGSIKIGDKRAKRSMVIGGELTANKLIEATELGSQSYSKTILRLGIAQEDRQQMTALEKDLNERREKIGTLSQIEYHHKHAPREDTEEVLHKVEVTREALLAEIASLEEEKNKILDKIKEAESAKVIVKQHVYPGVIIDINDCTYEVLNELSSVVFAYDSDKSKVTIEPYS